MSARPVLVFASFRPASGKEEEVLNVLKGMVGATRAEPGNETYDLYAAESEEGRTFHLFERYVGQGALEAHRASDHYKQYRADIPDLLDGPIDVVVLQEVDVA